MKNNICVCGSEKKQKDCCKNCMQVIRSGKDKDGNITKGESYWITFAALLSND